VKFVKAIQGTRHKWFQTSSMSNTFDLFKMARAMQSSCFSLYGGLIRAIRNNAGPSHPVEKFSPPSDTGASRSRKTLALTAAAGPSSSELGMRWTRRSASNWKTFSITVNFKRLLTISASSYSSKTSRVDRRVPLRIVGSSAKGSRCETHPYGPRFSRGMIAGNLVNSRPVQALKSELT
jgi:hypothetical protein